MAASQIKVLMDELAAILAEMGALDEGATDALSPDGSEAEIVVGDTADDEMSRKTEGGTETDDEDDEDEVAEMAKSRSFAALSKRADQIKAKIAFYERKAKKQEELRSVLERAAPAQTTKRDRDVNTEARVFAVPKNHGNLRAFRDAETAYRAGMHLRAHVFGDALQRRGRHDLYEEARRWCHDHGVESRAQAGGVNALGGVLSVPELATEIIRLVEEYGAFPQYARRVPMTSDTLNIARRTGGLSARPVGENAETNASDVNFDNVELVARIWGVANRTPNSLIEDSVIDVADLMAVETAQAFSEAFDNAGFVGDGTSQYHGVEGVCTKIVKAAHAGSKVTATSKTKFDELILSNFTDCVAKLPLYARNRSASWYISPAGWGTAMLRLAMLPGGASGPGGNMSDNVAAGFGERFLGYPVHLVHSMESSLGVATGKVAALFGDLSQAATFGERRAISIRTSADRFIEFDQTLTFATTRNAMVTHDVGTATKAGPIVALVFG